MTKARPGRFLADVQDTAEWFDRLAASFGTKAPDKLTSVDRMADHEAHLYGDRSGDGGRSGDISDPTGNAALKPHAKPLTEAAHHLDEIRVRLSRLEALHGAHSPQVAGKVNNEPGCQACARHRNNDNEPVWSPVYRTGTVAGRLEFSMALCRWDYEHVQLHGELAADDIREQWQAGKDPVVRVVA